MPGIIKESQAQALGFQFDTMYPHDAWHTSRYRRGDLVLEFTYKGTKLENISLDIPETTINHIDLLTLVTITDLLTHEQ